MVYLWCSIIKIDKTLKGCRTVLAETILHWVQDGTANMETYAPLQSKNKNISHHCSPKSRHCHTLTQKQSIKNVTGPLSSPLLSFLFVLPGPAFFPWYIFPVLLCFFCLFVFPLLPKYPSLFCFPFFYVEGIACFRLILFFPSAPLLNVKTALPQYGFPPSATKNTGHTHDLTKRYNW